MPMYTVTFYRQRPVAVPRPSAAAAAQRTYIPVRAVPSGFPVPRRGQFVHDMPPHFL